MESAQRFVNAAVPQPVGDHAMFRCRFIVRRFVVHEISQQVKMAIVL